MREWIYITLEEAAAAEGCLGPVWVSGIQWWLLELPVFDYRGPWSVHKLLTTVVAAVRA